MRIKTWKVMVRAVWIPGLLAAMAIVRAEEPKPETLPVLKVGSLCYSNVTVTSVTATDIYFSHAGGMGNAKLKSLSPELQKHFHFSSSKAVEAEKKQKQAAAQYLKEISMRKPPVAKPAPEPEPAPLVDDGGDDPEAPEVHAKTFRGQRPPQIIIDEWTTQSPEVKGKFVLVDFWATWCGPCKQSIPHLNELAARFKDRLVVIGLSDESLDDIRKMTSPHMDYFVGSDTQHRTASSIELTAIPHVMLMDPKGIVRYEGPPVYLNEKGLMRLMARYSE